jgi:hypothetical protein
MVNALGEATAAMLEVKAKGAAAAAAAQAGHHHDSNSDKNSVTLNGLISLIKINQRQRSFLIVVVVDLCI